MTTGSPTAQGPRVGNNPIIPDMLQHVLGDQVPVKVLNINIVLVSVSMLFITHHPRYNLYRLHPIKEMKTEPEN